eukprot:g10914.t1
MRKSSWQPSRTAVLLLSLLLSHRVSSTAVEKTSTTLGEFTNSPLDQPPPLHPNKADGNLDSCPDSRQEEGEGGATLMPVETDDPAASTASKTDADVSTAPASIAGLDDEQQEVEHSSGSRGEGYVPERYIVGCGGDRVEAARRKVFPVYLHGRSRKGMPVLWERIGKVDTSKADELNLALPELTPNYVFLNECVWRVVLDNGEDDNDDAKFITVEDVGGVRPWHLTPKVLSVLRALTGTMKAHYVERCYKSYIINAPRAFTALWKVVSAMLDPRTRAKVAILGTDFLGAMQEEIDMSQIPPEYGGDSDRAIGDSDDERKIQALVARLNLAADPEGTASTSS